MLIKINIQFTSFVHLLIHLKSSFLCFRGLGFSRQTLVLSSTQVDHAQCTAQKMKFSIKDLFNKCGQICRKLRIWPHLLKKSLMENFHFLCSVACTNSQLSVANNVFVFLYFFDLHVTIGVYSKNSHYWKHINN